MPKPDVEVDEEGDPQPLKFDVMKFYAKVITIDEDDIDQADALIGIDGAQSRIFELMRRIR